MQVSINDNKLSQKSFSVEDFLIAGSISFLKEELTAYIMRKILFVFIIILINF